MVANHSIFFFILRQSQYFTSFDLFPIESIDGTIDTLIGLDVPDINQGTANYAIRTGLGTIHLGDVIDIEQQIGDPANKANVVQFYAKDDKIFAKAPDPDNTIYDLTQGVGGGVGVIKTLLSGVAAAGSDRNLIIAAESGVSDDLIEIGGLSVGDTVWLRADSGDTITVKHNNVGATIKIHLYGDTDLTLDEENPLILRYVDTNVLSQVLDQNSSVGGLYASIAILRDEKSTGTNGGSASAGSWNARDLNTELLDPDSIVSLLSNQFTPVSGDYELEAYAPNFRVNGNRLRLYNVTAAAAVEEGQGHFGGSATGVNVGASNQAPLRCKFTASGSDAYRIDHYTVTGNANGLGKAVGDGSNEVYLVVILRRLN